MGRILVSFFGLVYIAAAEVADEWDLVQTFEASSHVFYGELTKTVPEPGFKVGISGELRKIEVIQNARKSNR